LRSWLLFPALESGYLGVCSLCNNSSNCTSSFCVFFCLWVTGLMERPPVPTADNYLSGGKCCLDHAALVYAQGTFLSSCLSKGFSTLRGMGCVSLSCKPPGLQIYMCGNNPVAFCFGMEATWPENTIIPFSQTLISMG